MSNQALAIVKLYAAFNKRDLDAALSLMHPEVEWPNGMEGGYVHGRDGVRDYWSRQWRLIDPHVEPQDMTIAEDGRVVVAVHQTIRDLAGRMIKNETVQHTYRLEAGLIRGMEIQKP